MVARLAPGESVEFADPKRPGSGFTDFVKTMLRGIAVGFGLPYEVAFSDYAGMNYSNARTAILDARRVFKSWQRFLAVQLCTPIWQLVIEEGVLREKLPSSATGRPPHRSSPPCTGSPRAGTGSTPAKEVAAQQMAVEAGFTSKSEVCAARGTDHEEVAKQRQREEQLEDELGLQRAAPAAATTPEPEEEAPEDDA